MEANTGLDDLFSNSAIKYSGRIAVCYDDGEMKQSLTYRDIYEKRNQIADALSKYQCSCEVVGLVWKSSPDMISVLSGILHHKAAFHSLDPEIPRKRLKYLITELHIRILVIHPDFYNPWKRKISETEIEVHQFDQHPDIDLCTCVIRIPVKKVLSNLAYVITTSGTTGQPKIVKVPHKCILPNILSFRKEFNVTSDDIIFHASPLTFDPSIVEIFMSVVSGATLLIVPEFIKMMPKRLLNILHHRNKVTIIQASPSLIHSFGNHHLQKTLLECDSSLRVLALGAEKCPPGHVIQSWRSTGNATVFYNVYGITEVSSWASVYRIKEKDISEGREDIPLGSPISDTTFRIVDKEGHNVTEGELLIGGQERICLINDESELVPGIFRSTGDLVRREQNGDVLYLGRIDEQIKKNGKRMNLVELEMIALKTGHVMQTAAVYHNNKVTLFVQPGIITSGPCTCVSNGDCDCPPNETDTVDSEKSILQAVKESVVSHLPDHYYPDQFILKSTFPMTKQGKVDKRKLFDFCETTTTPAEQNIYKLLYDQWLVCCGRPPDRSANFIIQGGNSLQAVHLITKLEEVLGMALPLLLDILLNNTYEDILNYVEKFSPDDFEDASYNKKRKLSECEKRFFGDTCSISEDDIKHRKGEANNSPECMQDKKSSPITCTNLCRNNKCGECDPSTAMKPLYSVSRCCRYIPVFDRDCHISHQIGFSSYSPELLTSSLSTDESDIDVFHNSCENCSSLQLSLKWSYNTGKCIDASPLAVICEGRTLVLIGSHSFKFAAICLETGECVWEVHLADRVESSACFSHCGRYVIVGCYAGNVYVLSLNTGNTVWLYKTGGAVKSSPCVDHKTSFVYIGSHDKHLYALDIQNKKLAWKQHLGGGSLFSSPCICKSPYQVYAATLMGHLTALHPENGSVIWRHQLDKPIFSSPAVTDFGVFVASVDGLLYCFSHHGQLVWRYKTDGAIFSSPCVWPTSTCDTSSDTSHMVVIGSHDAHVHCVDLQTGNLIWKESMSASVYSSPFICVKMENNSSRRTNSEIKNVDLSGIFSQNNLGTSNYNDYTTGTDLQSHRTLPDGNFLDRSLVAVCCSNGILKLLHLKSGTPIIEYKFPHEIFSSPIIVSSHLIVGCRDDKLYCLQLSM